MTNQSRVLERFAALAHPPRLRIARALRDGPLSRLELRQLTSLSHDTIVKGLDALRASGLVTHNVEERTYSLNPGEVEGFLEEVQQELCA